jgi:cell wall-associated NlpC family hydrolase
MTKLNSPDLSQINQEVHWAFDYIGRPWVSGGVGPDSFDCWSFFKYVQENHFGIVVPEYDVDASDFKKVANTIGEANERDKWTLVTNPKQGCAVLMAHAKYPSHVGLWLDVDGGGVLHCVKGEGVVFSTVTSLKNSGWGRVEYYKHVSNT